MTPFFLFFMLGFLLRSLFSQLFNAYAYLQLMKDFERRFLLLTANFIQWKSHGLTALALSYKVIEQNQPEEVEFYKEFMIKLDSKFDEILEEYIKDVKKNLPYETNYKDWAEAKKYIEKLIKESKSGSN